MRKGKADTVAMAADRADRADRVDRVDLAGADPRAAGPHRRAEVNHRQARCRGRRRSPFAWARIKGSFFPVVGTFFLAYFVSALPVVLITGGSIGYMFSQVTPGHPPDPNDPVLLGFNGLATIVTWFTQAFMMGGIYTFALKISRGETANFGDAFSGARYFGPTFVVSALGGLLVLPATIIPKVLVMAGLPPLVSSPLTLILLLPYFFFTVCWVLAFPLVVDRGLGGVAAMKESWRLTSGNRLAIFLCFLLVGLLAIAGSCLCCIGLPVVMALTPLAVSYFYLRLTGQPSAPTT